MKPAHQEGADFIVGSGEMADLIRRKDWSQTPLGPIAHWPQSLRTTVGLCLASNFPANIVWGPEHTQIYNDAFRLLCGDAHPGALGAGYRVTWESAWPAIGEPFEKALAGDAAFVEEQRMVVTRNGGQEEASFTLSLSPIRMEDGSIGGVFEARLAAGAARAAAPAAADRGSVAIAHEINNLLMLVAGSLAVLERQPDAARVRQAVDNMRRAVERGSALTRQLLAPPGTSPLEPRPIDLPACLAGMLDALHRKLGDQVRLVTHCAPGLWPALADAYELERVLKNLCASAREAMADGGTLSIAAENVIDPRGVLPGDYVRLSIGDTGAAKGPGEHLAQVHAFAKASGGLAEVDNVPGGGTTVALLLPRAREGASVPAAGSARSASLAVKGKPRVLLVEDDNEVAELVVEMLEHLGYQVTRAATAAEALFTLAHDSRIDLVFSDIMMPGKLTGVDLARKLRQDHPEMPVVLTSGYAESFKNEAHNEGLLLLPKPYAMDELAAMVERALAAKVH